MNYSIIIIGGGASALMLASLLPKKSAIIIETNPNIGAKISISGGGKCNITNTNMGVEYYLGESSFIDTILKKF
jgi:predicted flavoprotein YhiN